MQTQHIARCVMELSLYRREFIDIPSSSIAAGSLLLARTIVGRARKIVDEDQQSIQVAELLDSFLGEHLDQFSEIISAKYAPHYYSRASIIVREWYLAGKRFYFYAPVLSPSYVHNTPPPTPPFSQSSMETGMYSPGSSSSEDDAPLTPYSQAAPIPSLNVDLKENKQIIKPKPSIQSFTSLQISNKGV